jgi:type II secretory pathway component PulF
VGRTRSAVASSVTLKLLTFLAWSLALGLTTELPQWAGGVLLAGISGAVLWRYVLRCEPGTRRRRAELRLRKPRR